MAQNILNVVADLELALDERKFLQSWKNTEKKIQESFGEVFGAAVTGGLSGSTLRKLHSTFTGISKDIEASQARAATIAAEIQRKTAAGLTVEAEQAALKVEKVKLDQLQTRFREEIKHTERLAERRKDALREAERLANLTRSEGAEEFAESIQGAFDNLKSGDFARVLKGFGKGMEARGAGVAAKEAAGGQVGSLVKMLGKLGTTIGPLVLAMGAVVGAVAALVKIVLDADSAAKDLNKTLFTGGTVAADLGADYDSLTTKLNVLHDATGDFFFNQEWGTLAKDQVDILNAFNQTGFTVQEMTQDLRDAEDQMKALQDTTRAALTYSKLFGMDAGETATAMGEYMEDLGFTLGGIQERFAAIYDAASQSGFSTKRFFGMVLQATSGLSMYNVRLEEAAALLTDLTKVLGQKVGAEFFQRLTKGWGEKGMQERIKDLLLAGTKGQNIVEFGARKAAEEFLRQVGESNAEKAFRQAATKAGFTLDFTNPDALLKGIGKLNADQQAALVAQFRNEGVDDKLVQRIEGLFTLARSTRLKGGGQEALLARAEATEGLGMGAKLALEINSLAGFLKKEVHKLTGLELMALESTKGYSMEQIRELQRVSRHIVGGFDLLTKYQDELAKGTRQWNEGEAKKQVQAFKAYVNRNGEIVTARLDEQGNIVAGAIVKSQEEMLMSQGDALASAMDSAVSEDTALARQVAKNTTEISSILERGVSYVLLQIHQGVQKIIEIISFRSKDASKDAQALIREGFTALNQQERALVEEAMAASKAGDASKLAQIKAQQDRVLRVREKLQEGDIDEVIDLAEKLPKVVTTGTQKVLTNRGTFNQAIQRPLTSRERSEELLARLGGLSLKERQALATPAANDMLLQVGKGGVKWAHRVDPDDVGVIAKPGGAISQARGGGGGKVVHNHFYNDGSGIWNSLRKYEKAMGAGGR